MNLLDPHASSFIIRWLHIVAMTFMVGGAGLLCVTALARGADVPALLKFATAYEGLFWFVMGVQVITGVGNLGSFGTALPPAEAAWGVVLVLKLIVVWLLLLFSLVRSLAIVFLDNSPGEAFRVSPARLIPALYASTVLVLVGVLWLAEGLAHG